MTLLKIFEDLQYFVALILNWDLRDLSWVWDILSNSKSATNLAFLTLETYNTYIWTFESSYQDTKMSRMLMYICKFLFYCFFCQILTFVSMALAFLCYLSNSLPHLLCLSQFLAHRAAFLLKSPERLVCHLKYFETNKCDFKLKQ